MYEEDIQEDIQENIAKHKIINESVYFKENYKDDFLKLLKIPTVALCRSNGALLPYEYTDNCIRYRRDEKEVDKRLAKDLSRLTIYTFKRGMNKDLLLTIVGGNLWDYYCMKKMFGGR